MTIKYRKEVDNMQATINITDMHNDVQRAVYVIDSQEVPAVGDKINAHTLEGHDAAYFATAADVNSLNNGKASQSEVDALKKQVADLTALVNKLMSS